MGCTPPHCCFGSFSRSDGCWFCQRKIFRFVSFAITIWFEAFFCFRKRVKNSVPFDVLLLASVNNFSQKLNRRVCSAYSWILIVRWPDLVGCAWFMVLTRCRALIYDLLVVGLGIGRAVFGVTILSCPDLGRLGCAWCSSVGTQTCWQRGPSGTTR